MDRKAFGKIEVHSFSISWCSPAQSTATRHYSHVQCNRNDYAKNDFFSYRAENCLRKVV